MTGTATAKRMVKHSEDSRRKELLGLGFAMFVVAAYALIDPGGSRVLFIPVSRLAVEFLIAAAVAYLILTVARKLAAHSRTVARAWTLIGLGHAAYAAGDLIAATGTPLARDGVSLLMNTFYMGFYVLFIAGVLRLPIAPTRRRDRTRVFLDLLVVSLSAVIVLWYLLAEPLLLHSDHELSYAVLTVAFLAGDVALFLAVLFVGLRNRCRQALYPAVGWLGAAACAMFFADLAYAIGLLGQHDQLQSLAGMGFIVSHLLASTAAIRQGGAVESSSPATAVSTSSAWMARTGLSLSLAYSSLAVACVVQMTGRRHGSGALDVVASLLVIALVAARQWLEFADNNRLSKEAAEARDALEERVRQRTVELSDANRELARIRDELELRVAARTEALHHSNRELEAFAYSVSHDLRAPLRGVDGFSAILLEEHTGTLDEEGKRLLARIRAAAVRMGGLIDDLLRLSRISRVNAEENVVDLSERARRIAADLQDAYGQHPVELRIEDGLQVWGDGRLMDLVLLNLLSNAFKFSAEHPSPRIEVGARDQGSETVFFVRDNGVGFSMDYANKLFVPFQRLHSTARFEGNGIGLATVDRIIRRHGGRVWAEAEPGNGATFYFTLHDTPAADPAPPSADEI